MSDEDERGAWGKVTGDRRQESENKTRDRESRKSEPVTSNERKKIRKQELDRSPIFHFRFSTFDLPITIFDFRVSTLQLPFCNFLMPSTRERTVNPFNLSYIIYKIKQPLFLQNKAVSPFGINVFFPRRAYD
jgi:hypothetical protein